MLVIIGLLIGGVFVGQSLIHNAQLNGVITEYNRWQTAVKSFQQQYQTLPGDMTNATALWGVAAGTNGTDATCGNATESTTATCNGNGDGYLQWPAQGGGSGNVYESILFWKHLANAKMIEGSFTGTGGVIFGTNAPASKFGNGVGWTVYIAGWVIQPGLGNSTWFNADYADTVNVYLLGASNGGGAGNAPAMTPKDAWSIDSVLPARVRR